MAKAYEFYAGTGFNEDLIPDNILEMAAAEIFTQYGDAVKIGRKSLRKYGRNTAVGTGEFDITPFTVGSYTTETYLSTNGIDSLSSSDAADVSKPIYIEGMTRSGNDLTFVSQTVTTNASDGQTRVALTTPLCDCTRVRGVTAGNVWIYENTALTAGKPTDVTKIHNQLVATDRTSLKAATSIAKNNYFIVTGYWATLGKASSTAAADIRIKMATLGDDVFGDNFYTEELWSISLGQPPEGPPVRPYEIVKPNSRIVMTASSSSGTLDIKAGFIGFFADIVARRDQSGQLIPYQA